MKSAKAARQDQAILIDKMDQALKLLGMIAVKGLPQTAQIAVLSRIGLAPRAIADILSTTANTVRVTLVSIRKAGGHKKKRPIEEAQE